jgi:hypothetical protein
MWGRATTLAVSINNCRLCNSILNSPFIEGSIGRVFPLFTCQTLTVSTPIAIHAEQKSSETLPCGECRDSNFIFLPKSLRQERLFWWHGTFRYRTRLYLIQKCFMSERDSGGCRSRLRKVLFRWGRAARLPLWAELLSLVYPRGSLLVNCHVGLK